MNRCLHHCANTMMLGLNILVILEMRILICCNLLFGKISERRILALISRLRCLDNVSDRRAIAIFAVFGYSFNDGSKLLAKIVTGFFFFFAPVGFWARPESKLFYEILWNGGGIYTYFSLIDLMTMSETNLYYQINLKSK